MIESTSGTNHRTDAVAGEFDVAQETEAVMCRYCSSMNRVLMATGHLFLFLVVRVLQCTLHYCPRPILQDWAGLSLAHPIQKAFYHLLYRRRRMPL